jgi:uncharacterized protein YlxP (DUF503 family)
MPIGLLTLHIRLPGCSSLKEKRRRLKPLLVRLHREFNISVAEVDHNDAWRDSVVACTMVSNDRKHLQGALGKVVLWVENNWPDVLVVDDEVEII